MLNKELVEHISSKSTINSSTCVIINNEIYSFGWLFSLGLRSGAFSLRPESVGLDQYDFGIIEKTGRLYASKNTNHCLTNKEIRNILLQLYSQLFPHSDLKH